jgi:hypothetical protein
MSKIYGSLYLTNADWRFVYNTVLNYFNQEINLAYNEANSFFKVNGNLEHEDFQKKLAAIFSEREITNFRKSLIERSLLKASSKVYKPKKNAFTKYTNRTTYIKTPDVTVDFDKDLKTISIETADYDNFDKFMANNSFITEFINMINCINWPTRTGPKKTTKGCTLVRQEVYGNAVAFYVVGPNPPSYAEVPVEVVAPPSHLEATAIKTLKLTSDNPQDTYQPPPIQQKYEDL